MRGPWLTSVFGATLLVCLPVIILTGLLSYIAYAPQLNQAIPGEVGWLRLPVFDWPTRPAWLFRLNQGLHVGLGLSIIPVVLATLWSVVPKLFDWPPAVGMGVATRSGHDVTVRPELLHLRPSGAPDRVALDPGGQLCRLAVGDRRSVDLPDTSRFALPGRGPDPDGGCSDRTSGGRGGRGPVRRDGWDGGDDRVQRAGGQAP